MPTRWSTAVPTIGPCRTRLPASLRTAAPTSRPALDLGVRLADQARWQTPRRPQLHNPDVGRRPRTWTPPIRLPYWSRPTTPTAPTRCASSPSVVGIANYNDFLLEQLAQHGNGWYRYLSDTHQARSTFSRDNWLALSVPFADQTRAQVIWNDQVVESWRMIGYENRITSDESFVENRKEFAEIPVGAATTVFYELELTDGAWRDPARMADLERTSSCGGSLR